MLITIRIPNQNWANNRQAALSNIEWWLAQPALRRSFLLSFRIFSASYVIFLTKRDGRQPSA
jgi:hypothetical protein